MPKLLFLYWAWAMEGAASIATSAKTQKERYLWAIGAKVCPFGGRAVKRLGTCSWPSMGDPVYGRAWTTARGVAMPALTTFLRTWAGAIRGLYHTLMLHPIRLVGT